MTNSMVVKSSLWRMTFHSLGFWVLDFFSVTTAVSPCSRGLPLGIANRVTHGAPPVACLAGSVPCPAPSEGLCDRFVVSHCASKGVDQLLPRESGIARETNHQVDPVGSNENLVAVQLEKGDGCDECSALVAIHERMVARDAPCVNSSHFRQ